MTSAEIYARFRVLPGSEQIASEFGLAGVMWWLRRRRPTSIVEVGSGIGCLSTASLAAAPPARMVFIEDNAWCRSAFERNVGPLWWLKDRLEASFGRVDFLVIDGGDLRDDYYAQLALRAVVFFEGRRREQRRACRATLWADGRSWCEAEWKPRDRSKGYAVILTDPTWWERCWFAGVRMREGARDLLARLGRRPIGKKRKGGGSDVQAGLLTDLPSGQPRYTDARGCSPSASGLSPEDAIRRVRDNWPRGDG